jgi:hypothetical protein
MEESPLVNSLLQVLHNYETTSNGKLRESADKITALEQELAQLKRQKTQTSISEDVTDKVLKEHLTKVKDAPFDTMVQKAGVILEERLREAGDVSIKSLNGVKLVDALFNPEEGPLIFSEHPTEQEGIKLLYRGAIQYVRNPPMHKLIEYNDETARVLIRLIDTLLVLLKTGAPRSSKEVSLEEVRLMLRRKYVTDLQRKLFKALVEAGDKGLTNSELAEKLGITRVQLSGVLGSLGTRIARSKGFEHDGGIGAIFESFPAANDQWLYKIRPILVKALEAEKII